METLLEKAIKQGDETKIAKREADLFVPPMPAGAQYLWAVFHAIRRRIGAGMSGPQPISWADIDAYVRLKKFPLAPWEIGLIEDLDDIYLQACSERLKHESNE